MRVKRFRVRDRKATVLRVLLLVLGMFVLAGGAFGVYVLLRSGSAAIELTALPFKDGDPFVYTGSGFLYYADGKVYYKDDADAKKDYSMTVRGGEAGGVEVISSATMKAE